MCCAMSDKVLWNVVMWCGMMWWYMRNMVVCCDARCEMWFIPSDVECFDAILDMVVWCGMMVEMQCGMRAVGIVWCVVYIWMWCAWRSEVECGRDVECVVMPVDRFDVNYGAMWNVVWCVCEMGCNVECCNFRHGVIEMQNVWCGIWLGVECGVLVYGMLHNARCGKLQCDVKCGGVELWWSKENVAMWNVLFVVWCQMWKMMQPVVTSDVVVLCKIKISVVV